MKRKPAVSSKQPASQRPGAASGVPASANKKRNYDKPWQVPEKKKEGEGHDANSFLYSVYPDGVGPDSDLIMMLERDVIDKNPNVSFDDIADL